MPSPAVVTPFFPIPYLDLLTHVCMPSFTYCSLNRAGSAVSQFVNSYVSLFYIAFVEPFTTGCSYDSCLDSLCQSLGIIFCTRLFIANTIEVYLPRHRMRTKAKKVRPTEETFLFFPSQNLSKLFVFVIRKQIPTDPGHPGSSVGNLVKFIFGT